MQKVEGSSPFIRSETPGNGGFSVGRSGDGGGVLQPLLQPAPPLRSIATCAVARAKDPKLASYLRIEERELEAGGLN